MANGSTRHIDTCLPEVGAPLVVSRARHGRLYEYQSHLMPALGYSHGKIAGEWPDCGSGGTAASVRSGYRSRGLKARRVGERSRAHNVSGRLSRM